MTGSNWRVDCADAEDWLGGLPAGEVAYVITDPPYGIGLRSHGTAFRGSRPVRGDDNQVIGRAALSICRARLWPALAFASPKLPWPGEWRQHLV